MIFSNVKEIVIPEGNVKEITVNGVVLWSGIDSEPVIVNDSFVDSYIITKGYDCITQLIQYGKCTQSTNPTPTNPVDIFCNNGKLAYSNGVTTIGTPEIITLTGEQVRTISAENLFSCNQHYDEQDIVTGEITRRTAIRVLTGTESVSGSNGSFTISTSITCSYPNKVVCTHYTGVASSTGGSRMGNNQIKYGYNSATLSKNIYVKDNRFSTSTEFKAELARLYNEGTPVMLIYPPANANTSQTTPQSLPISSGTTTIVTTANVSGINFDIKYWTR